MNRRKQLYRLRALVVPVLLLVSAVVVIVSGVRGERAGPLAVDDGKKGSLQAAFAGVGVRTAVVPAAGTSGAGSRAWTKARLVGGASVSGTDRISYVDPLTGAAGSREVHRTGKSFRASGDRAACEHWEGVRKKMAERSSPVRVTARSGCGMPG
ncbi:hypothetical protein [Actinacidiphila sp. ITFR-21]|uniref:hypothetical protein n=1 Tax=Actinacidiphila sp. ITFR-21 TaxID=3075199 RepID=UPI00288B9F58|nr:hypothetical protein [Streptomyces sp. ITFR-21]WNI18170.1 hypothetical protein RLT57_23225 [Streptomyces sp. ITFR-21]